MSRNHFHIHAESDVADQGPIHDHFHGTLSARLDQRKKMRWVLGITAVFLLAEVVGGILSNSLALLADAGHMLIDVAALMLAIFVASLAERAPTPRRT